MKNISPSRKPQSFFIFVFLVGSKADFWLFVSGQYHRFLFLGEDCRWIRSQPILPPESVGYCIKISSAQGQSLEREGRTRGLTIRFFIDDRECLAFASQETYSGFITGLSMPAGCLNADGIIELLPLHLTGNSLQNSGYGLDWGKNIPGSLRNLFKFRHL